MESHFPCLFKLYAVNAMRKVALLILLFPVCGVATAQIGKIDTLYYDSHWRRVSHPAFASYYRIYAPNDPTPGRKPFRDYYSTGELQCEGGYITIDPNDDSKSVFSGEWENFYKSGKVEQRGFRVNGLAQGDYTTYYENGLIRYHATMKDGKAEGIVSEFSEDGTTCRQTEMLHGEPKYDYYTVSNQKGYVSKLRISDDSPVWDVPQEKDMKVIYRDGVPQLYYTTNGIQVVASMTEEGAYGHWYRVGISVTNYAYVPVEFDPEMITSALTKQNGEEIPMEVYTSERFMSKVRNRQAWATFFQAFGESLAAAGAGYSTSTTQTSVYASGSSGGYRASVSGYGTATTVSYDGAAAYQAQVIAANRSAEYQRELLQERESLRISYLRRTTIQPGESLQGYILIKYKRGVQMRVMVFVNSICYTFTWGGD